MTTAEKIRRIVFFEDYFTDFHRSLTDKAQGEVEYVFQILVEQEIAPQIFVKYIFDGEEIYEIRVSMGSNEYRTFFFFEGDKSLIEGGKEIVILNSFLKKSEKNYSKKSEKWKN